MTRLLVTEVKSTIIELNPNYYPDGAQTVLQMLAHEKRMSYDKPDYMDLIASDESRQIIFTILEESHE